mgnify:CR=1 FL=1
MSIFKRRNRKTEPAANGDSGVALSKSCAVCGHATDFEWALCPNCGAIAGAAGSQPPEAETSVAPAPAGGERARFGGGGNFYRDVTPAPAAEAEPTRVVRMDRTDPLVVLPEGNADETLFQEREQPIAAGDPQERTAILHRGPRQTETAETMLDEPAGPGPGASPVADRDGESSLESRAADMPMATGQANAILDVLVEPAQASEDTAEVEGRHDRAGEQDALPPARWAPIAFVVERNGPNAGMAHRLMEETFLGRGDDVDIPFGNSAVSKRHARIRWQQGAFVFWDLASSNFSFLVRADGQRSRILEPYTLQDGDTIELGDARITYLAIETDDPDGVAPAS